MRRRGGTSTRSVRVVGRGMALVAFVGVVTTTTACGVGGNRGVEVGHLRDLARRVDGGGTECPLAIPATLLRPSTVAEDAPILPLRDDAPASNGFVGSEAPRDGHVKIVCRYAIGGLAVRVAVVGVPSGPAVAEFADELAERGDAAVVLTFIDRTAQLPIGTARALPAGPPAAFTRVRAATGDVALLLEVDRSGADSRLPTIADVRSDAVAIARSLAN